MTVVIACRLADFLGFSVNRTDIPLNLDEIAAPLPERIRSPVRAQLPNLQAAITKEIRLFEASAVPESDGTGR